ncbi:MgtC/SapB family protein [Paenibacillus thalictri]|uniref:MgtC/SapB family protein n=1 Tax=Paenibacillus thalictri TaxID=2527873 RepID=A0A4Q9DJS6_9BACL|nr:MgtC/SapB family protein [Paenibacillus thalictri]TBL72694.1 MgtC/SapB family protein [Paenibacillus thalictri]
MSYFYFEKLGIAMLLGLLIGLDRQLRHKPLGMKTSMVISVASCLITMVSIESVGRYSVPGHTNMDPMRLAAQIVSGVGFIGAGVILRRSNEIISGLTTAAMVWAASALGIAVGAGYYKEAFLTVLLIITAINIFPIVFKLLGPKRLRERNLSVQITVDEDSDMTAIIDNIANEKMRVKHIKIKDLSGSHKQIQMVVSASEQMRTTMVYTKIKGLEHVLTVEVETIST